ncbi:molybdenum cofactor guanylyltransferase [Marilutibacter spongiae]|uniref:Molybdenum cofactor guanylyltransferase n=1 Tax=Marilutibacter spongiae TaxID=2025720 RepID=A0A7W3TLE2_9GAMM|nr:molybdenum cofactor guanylyltransferase [Lysobacter spongiae]MBB1060477.1 molybdenum cofactor guanylyltransferase [Lysobacter spongiae]
MPARVSPDTVTVGLLAGGRGTRLGGVDKAWLERDGQSQVAWLAGQLARRAWPVLVSANTHAGRYRDLGLRAIPDRRPDQGPLAGIAALAAACQTPWLLTLPVDLVALEPGLDVLLDTVGASGGVAADDEGPQPLVALWEVARLRPAVSDALDAGRLAVHDLQARLGMPTCRLPGVRLGNLNTPQDLANAGLPIPTPVEAPAR